MNIKISINLETIGQGTIIDRLLRGIAKEIPSYHMENLKGEIIFLNVYSDWHHVLTNEGKNHLSYLMEECIEVAKKYNCDFKTTYNFTGI